MISNPDYKGVQIDQLNRPPEFVGPANISCLIYKYTIYHLELKNKSRIKILSFPNLRLFYGEHIIWVYVSNSIPLLLLESTPKAINFILNGK